MGKPSKGTPKDMRLKANKTAAAKTTGKRAFPGAAAPFKKGGGRRKGG